MIIVVNFLVTEVVFCENYLDIEHLDKTYSDVDVFSYGEYEREDRLKRSAFYRSGASVALQVSDTLDYLLVKQGYNKQMRPNNFGDGSPVEVTLNIAIRNIGPIDELKEVFSLDCYFRQTWFDSRLQFNTSGLSQLALNWKFLTKIWKPDTVFLNGQRSYLHKITVPNRFIRVFPNGKVSYSQRLTLWAKCPMFLGKYPFDSQSCPLDVGSFSYTSSDVVYTWASSPVSLDEVELSQYKLTSWDFGVKIENSKRWVWA